MKKLIKGFFIFIGVMVLLGACASILGEEEAVETKQETVVAEETEEKEVVETVAEPKEEKKEDPAPPKEEPKEEPKEPEMTVSQKNAIKQAEQYISVMAFSKTGLGKQLEYEGYSQEDAAFALENITVDWREQAVKHAKTYLDSMAFSRQGLIDQLIYEGHSQEDAEHAANEVGL